MSHTHRALLVFDPTVAEIDQLLEGLPVGTLPLPVGATVDAVRLISAALVDHGPVDRLVLVGHGAPGQIGLGIQPVDVSFLLDRSRAVAEWRQGLVPGATIQLLGCATGAGVAGRTLVDHLAHVTGAAVAASDRTLGHATRGGDWSLTVTAGAADTHPLLNADARAAWQGVLSWTSGPDANANTFNGSVGNDTANGLGGNDTLFGNGGDDSLNGGNQDDYLDGGLGLDTLDGGDGNDTILGGDGADSIGSSTGVDSVDAGIGNDTVQINVLGDASNYETYDGGSGTDRLNLPSAVSYDFSLIDVKNFEHIVLGTGANVTVNGLTLFNNLSTIQGGSNTSTLVSFVGTGGTLNLASVIMTEVEQFSFSGLTSAINLTLPPSYAETVSVTGSSFNDVLRGTGNPDTLIGGIGNDTLIGGAGQDSMNGGAGDDEFWISIGDLSGAEIFNGGTEIDTVRIQASGSYNLTALNLVSIEAVFFPTSGSNSVSMSAAQAGALSTIAGGAGTDALSLGGTVDLSTKAISDIEQFSLAGSGSLILPTSYAIDALLIGNASSQTLTGGAGADTLTGGAAADQLTGGAGADVFYESSKADFAGDTITDFSVGDAIKMAGANISIVGIGNGTATPAYGIDIEHSAGNTILHVENNGVIGADFTITLTGVTLTDYSAVGDTLTRTVGAGTPTATGALTTLTLAGTGLTGPIIASFNASGVATATYLGSPVTVAGVNTGLTSVTAAGLTGSGVTVSGNAAANDLVGSAQNDTLFGFAGNDSLTGGAGADSLNGGSGVDSVSGGAGNDTIEVAASDLVSGVQLSGGSDLDTLLLVGGTTYALSAVVLTGMETVLGTAGTETISLSVGQLAQFASGSINLGNGIDVLEVTSIASTFDTTTLPLTGVEYLRIKADAGVMIVDRPDVAIEVDPASTQSITISGSIQADLQFGGAGADSLAGDHGADTLVGGGGLDTLNGGVGSDLLFGGAQSTAFLANDGADTVVGGADGDQITIGGGGEVVYGGAGGDYVYGGAGTVGALIIGDVDLSAGDNDVVQATAGADTIFGCGGNDSLHGNSGTDWLLGGTGDDTLKGDQGNDILWGDAGADRFVFEPDGSTDLVADFQPTIDTLDLSGVGWDALGLTFASIVQTPVAGGLQLSIGTTVIQLAGVSTLGVSDVFLPLPK
ncbi:MAG: DUF4347 domain-containing protein [Alphaproteobacteria bacterium]|nr:DUF4347 domain-containing protein [Alphaproteobacteria bacterium]